jgi:hypothetical protein
VDRHLISTAWRASRRGRRRLRGQLR